MTLLAHHERPKADEPTRWVDRSCSRTYAFEPRVEGADLPEGTVTVPDGVLAALDEATKLESSKRWLALEQPEEPELPPGQGDPRDV
jgi:hypothetical protein